MAKKVVWYVAALSLEMNGGFGKVDCIPMNNGADDESETGSTE